MNDTAVTSTVTPTSGWFSIALAAVVAIGGFIASTMYGTISENSTHRVQTNVIVPDLTRRVELLEEELARLRPRT